MSNFIRTLSTLLSFLAKKRGWYIAFIFVLILSALLESVLPFFLKFFIDAIPRGISSEIFMILTLYVTVRLIHLVMQVSSHFLGDVNLVDSAADARTTIFKHLQELDFAFHTTKSTGSLISAMKRGDGSFFSLEHAIHFRILPVIVSFFVLFYVFSTLDIKIAFIAAVSFVLTILLSKIIVGYNITSRRKFVEEDDEISGIIVDNLVNYDTVKLFAKENWEYKRLVSTFTGWKRYLWQYANSFRLMDLSIGTLFTVSIFLIFYISLRGTIAGQVTAGEFALVAGFVASFYPKLNELVWGFREMAKNYADVQAYFGILDQSVLVKDPKNPVTIKHLAGEVNFDGVSFGYVGTKSYAVKNLDLIVRQGQSVALAGRSGSGKTTLSKLLLRFYDVNKGKITLDGIDIRDMDKSHLRSFIGVVPQEPIMFNNTVAYNIGYGKKRATIEEITASAKMANLHNFIMSLPKKYDTNVGERGVKLSGGQKQRLAIARMFLSDPEIIIFDEATSQLDSENEKLIQDAFWKVAHNKTTIIIAHRLSTALRADKIVVLNKGRVVEEGSHRELTQKKGLYAYFWELQTSDSSNLPVLKS